MHDLYAFLLISSSSLRQRALTAAANERHFLKKICVLDEAQLSYKFSVSG